MNAFRRMIFAAYQPGTIAVLGLASCLLSGCGDSDATERIAKAQQAQHSFLVANEEVTRRIGSGALGEAADLMAKPSGNLSPMAKLRFGFLIECGSFTGKNGNDALAMYEESAELLAQQLADSFLSLSTVDGKRLDSLSSGLAISPYVTSPGVLDFRNLALDLRSTPKEALHSLLTGVMDDLVSNEDRKRYSSNAYYSRIPDFGSKNRAIVSLTYPAPSFAAGHNERIRDLQFELDTAGRRNWDGPGIAKKASERNKEQTRARIALVAALPQEFDIWHDGLRVLVGCGDLSRARELRDTARKVAAEQPSLATHAMHLQQILGSLEARRLGEDVQARLQADDESRWQLEQAMANLTGRDRPRDSETGFRQLRNAADSGCGTAMVRLGMEAEWGRIRLEPETPFLAMYEGAARRFLNSMILRLYRAEIEPLPLFYDYYSQHAEGWTTEDLRELRSRLESGGLPALREIIEDAESYYAELSRDRRDNGRRELFGELYPSRWQLGEQITPQIDSDPHWDLVRSWPETGNPLDWAPQRSGSQLSRPTFTTFGRPQETPRSYSAALIRAYRAHSGYQPDVESRLAAGAGAVNGFIKWMREYRPRPKVVKRFGTLEASDRFSSPNELSASEVSARLPEAVTIGIVDPFLSRLLDRLDGAPLDPFLPEECVGVGRLASQAMQGRLTSSLSHAAELGNDRAVRELADYYSRRGDSGDAYFWANIGQLKDLRESLQKSMDPELIAAKERLSSEWWTRFRLGK